MPRFVDISKSVQSFEHNIIFTARKRSLGKGNIFAPACHSVHRGGGVCRSACWDTTPQEQTFPPDQTPPPGTVHAGRYGQQAGGMHPTGMQSCRLLFSNYFPKMSAF